MKVLLLGPSHPAIERAIALTHDQIMRTEEPLVDSAMFADFIVSFGYRHIISGEILARFGERAVNLHVSYLPWNRGADPNLWSFLDDTPKGVTIHVIDEGLDTGPIIAQREVNYSVGDTLRTTYERLSRNIEDLFSEVWVDIREGKVSPSAQQGIGTIHKSSDKTPYAHLLTDGWDTPVSSLIGVARQAGGAGSAVR